MGEEVERETGARELYGKFMQTPEPELGCPVFVSNPQIRMTMRNSRRYSGPRGQARNPWLPKG